MRRWAAEGCTEFPVTLWIQSQVENTGFELESLSFVFLCRLLEVIFPWLKVVIKNKGLACLQGCLFLETMSLSRQCECSQPCNDRAHNLSLPQSPGFLCLGLSSSPQGWIFRTFCLKSFITFQVGTWCVGRQSRQGFPSGVLSCSWTFPPFLHFSQMFSEAKCL